MIGIQTTMSEKMIAIAQWLNLAEQQEREAALGVQDIDVAKHNAALYRKVARSIEVGIETGVSVCVCCWKPFGRGTLQK